MKQMFSYQDACDWINLVEKRVTPNFLSYFNTHKIRYMNTFQALRHLEYESPPFRVIDLAGSGLFTGLAREKLGAEELYFTHFEHSDREARLEQPTQVTLPLDLTDSPHRSISWNFDAFCEEEGEGIFDLIFALEVIEHIATDPARFLRESRRLLSNRGHLILTTPNICSLGAIERILNHNNPISYPFFKRNRTSDRHNIEYTLGQLRTLVTQSGLEVVRAYTVDSWTSPSLAFLNFCRHANIDLNDRGDNIILIARRAEGEPVEFPADIYD